jgi:cytochrome c-type biogenesis protein CcmE
VADLINVPPAPRVAPAGSRRRLWLAGALIVAALGFLLFQGLGNATVYFRTADEAVADKAQLGTRRFRIEGTVVAGSVRPGPNAVDFAIKGTQQVVQVSHAGDPPELFQPDIPVVLEGRWAGEHFASDRIMVKHTSEYKEKNPDRVGTYVGEDQTK